MDVLMENELIRCELDSNVPVLVHRWLRKPTSEELKKELTTVLDIYINQKKDISDLKWLADTELLGELTKEDEDWLENTWDKMLFDDAEVKVHAVILGKDIYADYSMESFLRNADKAYRDKGVKLGLFMNKQEALEWLLDN